VIDKDTIRAKAREIGFDAVRFARAETSAAAKRQFAAYLAEGRHGDMAWMNDTAARRADPQVLWPDARTAIMLALNYGPDSDPRGLQRHTDRAAISVYARNKDYHDVIKKRLKRLAAWLATASGAEVKVFVDTAPVLEKPLAQAAGLGWQGKHTNLVSRDFGSWLFLGEVFTTLDLEPDAPETDHCGACRACLDVCPTGAFTGAREIDARRCISYLTIEHKGPIPRSLRPLMGNRIYGCDDCLAVCPWNKFAVTTSEPGFLPRSELSSPLLADLARLDDAGFRALFSGSPIKRIGRDRFVRNVLIAVGNSGRRELSELCAERLSDSSALVRGAAVWALRRLCDAAAWAAASARYRPAERDSDVRQEWDAPDAG
jgi:epoxyqueuosine reductase